MDALRATNLGLRFLLELASLTALAYWGFQAVAGWTRWPLGVGAPFAAALLWSSSCSGRPVAALAATGRTGLAITLAILVVVNRTLMVVWNQ
jgi:Protein of unknown function (DUF2568)